MRGFQHVSVILNPAADGGAGARIRPRLQAELSRMNLPYQLFASEGPGHARSLTGKAVSSGSDLILVVGGDGTLHEVANGLLSNGVEPPPVAVIPVGTGNDFQKMLGPRVGLDAALESIAHGTIRRFDVGRATTSGGAFYFVNLLGLGIDVEVLRRRSRFPRLRGLPQYLAALASALVSFEPASFRMTIQGHSGEGPGMESDETVEDRTLLMAVTVGPSVGGGFLLNPEATPFDGLLDLFFVRPLGMTKLLRYIPRVIRGTHQGLREIVQRRILKVTIQRSDGSPFHFEMDGETMADPVTSLEVEVCPDRLPVVVPGDAS